MKRLPAIPRTRDVHDRVSSNLVPRFHHINITKILYFQSPQIIYYGLSSTFALGEGFHSRETLKEDFAAT